MLTAHPASSRSFVVSLHPPFEPVGTFFGEKMPSRGIVSDMGLARFVGPVGGPMLAHNPISIRFSRRATSRWSVSAKLAVGVNDNLTKLRLRDVCR